MALARFRSKRIVYGYHVDADTTTASIPLHPLTLSQPAARLHPDDPDDRSAALQIEVGTPDPWSDRSGRADGWHTLSPGSWVVYYRNGTLGTLSGEAMARFYEEIDQHGRPV